MSKQVFWPLAFVVMGLIFLASNLGMLHVDFVNLWPLILIIAGLGGLVTSDRMEWMSPEKKSAPKKSSKSPAPVKTRRR
jgi:hypothetical protein